MQDYFKEVEEESVRDNFVICYELLDEMVDFGYPQTTDAQILQVGSPISSQYFDIVTTTDQSAASIHITCRCRSTSPRRDTSSSSGLPSHRQL